jgi:hypothetical protein
VPRKREVLMGAGAGREKQRTQFTAVAGTVHLRRDGQLPPLQPCVLGPGNKTTATSRVNFVLSVAPQLLPDKNRYRQVPVGVRSPRAGARSSTETPAEEVLLAPPRVGCHGGACDVHEPATRRSCVTDT